MTKLRTDTAVNWAILSRFEELPLPEQAVISSCAITLRDEIQNMNVASAREVLFQIGRLMVITEDTTIRRGER